MTTEKNILFKDGETSLYPVTKAELVKTSGGENLGNVEPNAQVNVIESITVNGTPLTVTNKVAALTIAADAEYRIVKQATADAGYSGTYYLTKDGTAVGDKINIPKDLFVQSVTLKTVTTANNPVNGYKVGDKYIDWVIANSENQHIYLLVSELVDVYTNGNGIVITNNSISIDTSIVATKTDLAAKQNSLTSAQINAVNSGITSAKVGTYDGYASTIANKADKATTLSGYGITDSYTKTQIDNKFAGLISYVEVVG